MLTEYAATNDDSKPNISFEYNKDEQKAITNAPEIGCKNLHFVNPNGIHNENHFCCAYDLYLVARECQKYEAFREIVQSTAFTVPATDIYPHSDRTCTTTNELLSSATPYYYPYCTGIKTGHTTPAGECLISSSSHKNIDLICVVLGGKIHDGINYTVDLIASHKVIKPPFKIQNLVVVCIFILTVTIIVIIVKALTKRRKKKDK